MRSFSKFFRIADAAANRLGVSFTVLLLILVAVWTLGSSKTKDDFIREVLFREITHTPYLSYFFLSLVAIVLLGGLGAWVRARLTESAEVKRVAAEKGKLQQKLLEKVPLAHTASVRSDRGEGEVESGTIKPGAKGAQ